MLVTFKREKSRCGDLRGLVRMTVATGSDQRKCEAMIFLKFPVLYFRGLFTLHLFCISLFIFLSSF